MRRKLSSRSKKKVLIISSVVCVIILVSVVYGIYSLTRNVLNNDDIRVNVELLSLEDYDEEKALGLFDFTPREYFDLLVSKKELCVIELKYSLYNHSSSDVDNFSAKVSSLDDEAMVYACSDVKKYSESDRIYICTQYVVLDKSLIYEEYFKKTEPADFKAPLRIKLGYDKKGEPGRKQLSFSIVKREE